MSFKLKQFCVVIVIYLSNTNSLDVKCIYKDPFDKPLSSWCRIEEANSFQPGEQLNLIEVENQSEIKKFVLFNATAMILFPNEIFDQLPSLNEVTIENTSIESLTNISFVIRREKLDYLRISCAKVKTVPRNLLSLLPNLKILNLWQNKISEIENDAFSSSLKSLDLSFNQLKRIKKETLSSATHLRDINLIHNLIEEIEDGAFNLTDLESIQLNLNRLKTLPLNLFSNAPELTRLSLEWNQLTNISALEKAQDLHELSLNNNPTLKDVNVLSLNYSLKQLQLLRLRDTGTSFSNIKDPLQSTELIVLDISKNNISDSQLLHQLKGLRKVTQIDLSDNQLVKLDDFEKIKEFFTDLTVVELQNNNWDCDWIKLAKEVCSNKEILCSRISEIC